MRILLLDYAQIIRDGRGNVLPLYPLLPDRTVDRTSTGELYNEYRKDTGTVLLRKEEVLHIPGLGFVGLMGYIPLSQACTQLGGSTSIADTNRKVNEMVYLYFERVMVTLSFLYLT